MYTINGHTIELVAHRGANGLAPENTRAAVEQCLKFGVDVIELDVQRSLDGTLYNFHDRSLNRTTNGSGSLFLRHSRYIDALDAGSWFSHDFAGERVPKIQDLIHEFRGKLRFYLDIKSGSLRKIASMIRASGIADETFVWFANPKREKRFRRIAPDVALKVNVRTPEDITRIALPRGARIVEISTDNLSSEIVAEAHSNNLKVMVNDLHGDHADYRNMVDLKVDMINLDRPERFADFVTKADG